MNEGLEYIIIYVIIYICAGAIVSLVYHGSLWYTVNRLIAARRPALLTLGSFALRLLVTLPVFYLAARAGLNYLVATLAGFFAVRLVMIRILKPGSATAGREAGGGNS